MKTLHRRSIVTGSLLWLLASPLFGAPASLKVLTQSGYLPANPVLVRVEALDATGQRDRDLWDAQATLSADAGVTLSTNQVTLRNGMGSVLVTFSGGGDFNLTATLGSLSANRALQTLVGVPVTTVSGTLPGSSTTWSNVVNITADVTVPAGHTLTIRSNTLVLMNGVASGTAGTKLIVNGTVNSLGTELHPVTITCANSAQRWGQIRHDNAQPSVYRHTLITRGGRSTGEGHTGQAPIIRPNNSTVTFESCSLTDHADASGTPGKIGYGINANLTFIDCLFARARMGPEIQGTALLCTNTWFIDMRGPDDADGIYLHDQQVGQQILLTGCVLAGGDDDGIDTLGAVINVDNCILRDWNSAIEDAKAISVFNGATHIRRSLITDSTVGVAAKWSSGSPTLVTINNSTVSGNGTNVLAQFKSNAPGPFIDYRITNSVLWGGDAVQSDFAPTNFTIVYSDLSEPWAGAGNITSDPLFVNAASRDFHLRAASPAINSGDPASPLDADGSRADMGHAAFQSGTNTLITFGSVWKYLDNGSNQGTNWAGRTFDDASWASGPAQLGYGDSPADEATIVSFGPNANAKYVTTYFRRAFHITDATAFTNLSLRLLRDDGGVVYLNGAEIFRSANMPAGAIAFDTLATGTGENDIDTSNVTAALPRLVDGQNVVAVELHQQALNSSDLSFDLELTGVTAAGTGGNLPPAVALTNPANNTTVTEPANIALAASASDTDGTVAKVEFFQNGVKLGEDDAAPYEFAWNGVAAGIYSLTAVATDNLGGLAQSSPVTLTVNPANTPTTNTLIAAGSVWKYLDDGSDQGAEWSAPGFNDSAWGEGPAQLGYGDGDEATNLNFGPDSNNKYPTTYFRRSFTVSDPARVLGLTMRLLRDDGAIAYLNGQEVQRLSMPTSGVNYQTFATTASEYGFESANPPASLLVAGVNVIAVEVHQGNGSSSDLTFDLELLATVSAETNSRPIVSITSPANNVTLPAPANITISASASDTDGTVTNVAFFANGAKLADDAASPFSFNWNSVVAGSYALVAVATDNVGLVTTSSVVNVTVSANTAPPVVFSKSPAPGNVTGLTQLTVTFSKPVLGVDAADLLINGAPASTLTPPAGPPTAGTNFLFTFPQPAYGTVSISWAASHGITDVFTPPANFDRNGAGATWQYQLLDAAPPVLATLTPTPGSTVAALTSVTVAFSEPVTGVNAADLRLNTVPATTVSGFGAGPYVFGFAQPAPGTVQLTWTGGHGIQDASGNAFAGGGWGYTLDTNATGVIISEIMYHPSSENVLEEYIELFNKGASVVDLTGWRFSGGVQFTFPNVSIPAGGYLAVAADVATFNAKYPGVANVVGGWTGVLNNSSEDIDLDDALGNRVDSVEYADEGDWGVRQRGPLELNNHRGWVWFKEHDGLGKSLELLNPQVSNNEGQNWAASRIAQGTPGSANSILTNNIAPMILGSSHLPVIPKSSDSVLVTARIVDESAGGLTVNLSHRASTATPPPFTTNAMRDDGLGGDAAANDGLFTAIIPAQPNNTVIEFFIGATDQQGATRTWPAPAIAAADGAGPTGQLVNALYQVDDTIYAGSQPLYKLIMTEEERAELAIIPSQSNLQGPNSQMNGTFISVDGDGTELRYLAGFRNRGHGSRTANPPNYRVNFRSDEPWKDKTAINLNVSQVHAQHLGSILARKSGVAGANTIPVQVRVNNQNRANSGAPMFGSYAANEVVDGDWADAHFPLDGNGNVYRAVRDITPPDFSYRGEDQNSYTNTWFKESNTSEDDWTDLIAMLRVVGTGNATSFTTENVRQVVNVEQWLRHLAVMNLFGNAESGLNSGYNDDYFMYRGVSDPRFILTYYDLDQILGQGGSFGSTASIFSATANNGSGQAFDRFLRWPEFEPIYYRILKELLETALSQPNFNATVDQALGSYVTAGTISSIKTWMDQRRAYVLGLPEIQSVTNVPVAIATLAGLPRSPSPFNTATLTVGGTGVVAYRYQLNGGGYGAETPVATAITLNGLANGTNTLAVIAKNANGAWQSESAATVRSWVVNTAWPTVRLNEVLARNDSAVNHFGTFPDLIELFNEGGSSIDLSGLRLTDDLSSPNKFTFPAGTSLAAGARLVVYANNPDGTAGLHLGFSLNQDGDGVYLLTRASDGNTVLDSVVFGLQLPNLSIGRFSNGDWLLTQPSFGGPAVGGVNVAQPVGNPRNLRINEFLASGVSPNPDDFIELLNPDALPVALGGPAGGRLYLTDQPIGAPTLHPIAPLSFIAGNGYAVFIADGNTGQGANHVDFGLAAEQGEIGLISEDLTTIDCVIYGPQQTGVSFGRCPDGTVAQKALVVPTPGSPNACPFTPPPPITVTLVPMTNHWRYENSGADLGVDWRETSFDDSSWNSGPALLGVENAALPAPGLNTIFSPYSNTQVIYYFRTTFVVDSQLAASALQMTIVLDDGAVFYLNGQPLTRVRMPEDPIDASTLPIGTVDNATIESVNLPTNLLVPGINVLAVEVHNNANPTSSDIILGLALDALVVTNSPVLAGVLINEVLANNTTLEEPDGSKPDWVELYNPSSNAVDVAGMSLTDTTLTPQRWVFPAGSIVPALGFLKVRLDPDLPASSTNTGFGLKANGGAVYLYNRPADGGAPASSLTYGLQAADWSLGRVPDGSSNWALNIPSFGGANLAATLGDPLQLKMNEWMANPTPGNDDWIEVYNPNPQPVSLSGLWLSDSLITPKYQIPALSFIGAGSEGYLRFWAANGADSDFTGFGLSGGGEAVAIWNTNSTLIHGFSFGTQASGVSEGLLPDGSSSRVFFNATPTPGNGNFLPLNSVVINEILTHTDPPLEDAVELFNPTGDDADISGWYLSDSQNNLLKYRIPNGTVVPAGGFKVFYEYQFNGENLGTPFSFSSAKGDEVYLSQSTTPGTLTGYRAFAEFGASENGVSFGRYQTSVGVDFTALSARTFGVDNPATTNQFRTGTGKTNAYPKVGPIVINEIMYNYPGDTNDTREFVELHNILGTPVPLYDPANPANTWRLRRGIDFNFPPNTTIPAGGFLVVVNFDPLTDATSLAAFRAAYGTNMTLFGPYGSKLDNGGEDIELRKPDAPQTAPGPDFGQVPYVVADRIVYADSAPWPVTADGVGDALKRITPSLYGNDPANWAGGAPTPGAANFASGATNTPPVLNPIGNRTVNEGVLLTFTATATDTDAPPQSLTFSLDAGAPGGASITPEGAFTWAPSEAQGPGVYPVTVRVTDNGSPVKSDFETISITVNDVNSAPVLNPIGNKTGNEGSLITFTATAIDTDEPAQSLTYTLDAGAPAAASITAGGVFTWTPTETDGPGVYNVTVRVTDNGSPVENDFETIAITVNEANVAPVLAAIGNKMVNEGALLTFTATATDSDLPAQTRTFTLDAGAPVGASITTSGVFTWTPHETNGPGVFNVTVRVTDNGSPAASDFETIAITVNEVNVAPVLASIGNKSVAEGSLLTFTATATDNDRPTQTLTFSLDAGSPSGASITSGGVFTWTPTAVQGPSNYTVTVRVTDNGSPALDDFETINIDVSEGPTQTTLVGFTNQWRYLATGTNLFTAWRGTSFDDSVWPTGRGVFYNETSPNTVIPAPTNTFLPLTGPGGQRITNYYFRTKFFLPADASGVTLTASNVLDDGAVIYINGAEARRINMNSGTVLATTFAAASWEANTFFVTNVLASGLVAGENVLAVEVHQQSANSSDVVFGLSLSAVVPPQAPIVITSQPTNVTVLAGSAAQFSVVATGSSPFYQWLKNGAPIVGANGATHSIPNAQVTDGGTYSVMVSNLASVEVSADAVLTVNTPANSAPVLGDIGNRTVNEGSALNFTATATDAEAPPQTLVFSLDAGAPAGASITAGGAFTWTPNETNGPGVFNVTVRVTDSGSPALSDTETITITVNEVNLPPVLAAIGNRTVAESNLLTFTATATDADSPAQTLAYSLDAGAPAGASVTAGGVFTWTPHETNGPGVFNVTVRVTDSGSPALSDTETITITVNEVNLPPVLAAIGNKSVNEGTLLTFTATATDPDLPAQTRTFTLDAGAPSGATINPTSGVFNWTPPAGHTPATNQVTVRVTDNGSPATNDFEMFNIVVVGAPRITSIQVSSPGVITVQWASAPGKTYRVEYKASLSATTWLQLGGTVPSGGSTTSITDNIGANDQRFYRIVMTN